MVLLLKNYRNIRTSRKETPAQKSFIRVVSIAADTDKKKHENSIKDFPWKDKLCDFKGFEGENFSNFNVVGSPSFYLLDKDNKLSGMFFAVSDLEQAINN